MKDELLKSFHEQFADNQNHHQEIFLQVISVIVTAVIGFGYVFTNGGELDENKINPSEHILSIALVLAKVLLTFGFAVLINMGLGYRRDQFVIARIRMREGILRNRISNQNVFPAGFDPAFSLRLKRWRLRQAGKKQGFWKWVNPVWMWENCTARLSWMPNFHNFLFMILTAIDLTMVIAFLSNPFDDVVMFDCNAKVNVPYVVASCSWLGMTIYILYRTNDYYHRLARLYSRRRI